MVFSKKNKEEERKGEGFLSCCKGERTKMSPMWGLLTAKQTKRLTEGLCG